MEEGTSVVRDIIVSSLLLLGAARGAIMPFSIPSYTCYEATVLKPYSIGSQDQGRVLLPLGDLDNGR